MGNSKYLDGLAQSERDRLLDKLLSIQGNKCFICGEEIVKGLHKVNIDHIRPLATGGKDEPVNFAATHEHCNKSKQDADLEVARQILRLQKIMRGAELNNETPSLKHVLAANGGSKYAFHFKMDGDRIIYTFSDIGDDSLHRSEVFIDPLSGEKTAFIKFPIQYLFHDEVINPRGINSSINLLIKEFHKPNPQLHLSLARLDSGKVKIFDGQHKAVAQISLGVKEIVVRLFIEPDIDRLIETNTIAGSKLKQIAFDKAIVRQLHDTLYAERLRKYQVDHLLDDDDFNFSEQNLVDYFKGERGNIKLYIINSQKNAITRNPDNKLQAYINFEGRGNQLPLSYSSFEKTFLSRFVNAKTILNTPISYKTDEGLNPRILEKEQLTQLCNIIAEEILINRYDPEIGTYRIENSIAAGNGNSIPDVHLIAYRLLKEEILYNWVKYLELTIVQFFATTGVMFDRENLFQQKIPDQLWTNIRNFVKHLREMPIWRDRSMSATIFGGKQNYDYWALVFSSGHAPDGTQLLVEPLNVMNMIQP